MARWRLMNPHYLTVPGTEWERVEVSRETGKQARVRYPVGLYLDPNEPGNHNYPGEVIVAHDTPAKQRKDVIFVGPPTPDMEPVDDEAEKITEEWRPKWVRPMDEDALPSQGGVSYGDAMIKSLEAAISKIGKNDGNVSISVKEFDLLKKQVAELAKQNEQLRAGK